MADYNSYKFRKIVSVKTTIIAGLVLVIIASGTHYLYSNDDPGSSLHGYGLVAFGVTCGAWITVYKIHLLNKYCPYLKTLEDRRYDRGDPPSDLLTFWCFYKMYLLHKYCSYLKTLEDRRYDRGDPPPDLLTFWCFYKMYLLHKYCPYLKTVADRRYDG